MKSISKTLDEMNKFPEKRNFYIVMDNAPIHTSQDITNLIEIRDYEAIYLPPYSSELNSIENFWSVVKNSIKRSVFQETEDLKTRISEVSQSVSRKTLHNITQHSVENFQKCFDKEPLWWTFGQFRSSIKLRTLLITQTNSEWCKREFEPFANTNLGQWKGELWAVRKANFSQNFGGGVAVIY